MRLTQKKMNALVNNAEMAVRKTTMMRQRPRTQITTWTKTLLQRNKVQTIFLQRN
jgi:hypothetical protein